MVHRWNRQCLAALVFIAVFAGSTVASTEAEARSTSTLSAYLDEIEAYIKKGAKVRWRGYHGAAKELTWVKRKDCDMTLKRKVWGFPEPSRAVKPFIQYFRLPLGKVQMARVERINYRHDVRMGKLKYYGFAVVLKTNFWDIEVSNRLGDTITREQEIQIVFEKEKTAREFLEIAEGAVRECGIHSLGVGDDWNRVSYD